MTDQRARGSRQSTGNRASDLVAAQLKELRARRGHTVKQLAARCRELGAADLTANVLTNIEVRRRDVSVDELLVIALALDIAPVYLLAPPPNAVGGLAITHDVVAEPEIAGLWIRGDAALPASSARLYLEHAAERSAAAGRTASDHAVAVLKAHSARLAVQYEAEAQQFLGRVRDQVAELVTYLEESVASGVSAENLVEVLQTVKGRVQPASSELTAGPSSTGR